MPTQHTTSPHPARSEPGVHRKPRRGVGLFTLLLLVVLALAGCVSVGTTAQPTATATAPTTVAPGAADLQQQVINVIHAVQPSVVEIDGFNGGGQSIGSGEILTSDGYIVTNDHVVRGFTSFSVRMGANQIVPAKLIGQAPQDDLAVLKVAGTKLPPISFGDSSKVQVGQFVIAIGSPLGLAETATIGIVSALNRAASEGVGGPASTLVGLIQTSAPINPGNSGGALVDLSGRLIGIPTLAAVDPEINAPANGIGFAIPSNRVQFVTQQLIQHGRLVSSGQGFLGIEGQDVTPQLAAANGLAVRNGVLVAGFAKDTAGKSPAQQAGLRVGDSIVAVNNQQIAGSTDLASLTLTQPPGARVNVTIARGPRQQTIQVVLGERPVAS
ncbi:MAG TPA: trypsin-like peptidase domain-containing protein [Ktedonobacterales bacterium]|nr:trypsin-like peptidase domain-containing protein [Ktedonobacterales bacterium]